MIPPWKLLKHAITEACSSDECDIPLASLRRAGYPVIPDYNDFNTDPEHKAGHYEVERCTKEVWAAC